MADLVILTVKAALTPVLERLAAAEARLTGLPLAEKSLGELRDRMVMMETKAAAPVLPISVDFAPVLERVAVTESQIGRLSGMEDAIAEVRDRLLVTESRSSVPPASPPPEPVDLAPVLARVNDLHVKVAVLEARPGLIGPSGPAGKDGRDGQNGKDGADGLGFDDLTLAQTDERSLTVKAIRGDRVKDIGTATFPVEIYRGVYVDGRQYERGDCVTWGGSEFHCNEQTTSKPEQSKAWTLKVKRGRDGRDGKDAPTIPVVSVVRPS
jgi:hypothetical protein